MNMKVIDMNTGTESLESSTLMAAESKYRRLLHSSAGFTLVELIVVSAIIGVLAGLAIPAYNRFIENVKVTRAISEIRGIEKDVYAKFIDTSTFPNTLNEIGLGALKDPWGRAYEYKKVPIRVDNFLNILNTEFDIYSIGPDGVTDVNIQAANGLDDIVRTSDGGWIGRGEDY
jgi:general secretion pathway protein G